MKRIRRSLDYSNVQIKSPMKIGLLDFLCYNYIENIIADGVLK